MAYGHDPRSNSCLFLIDFTGQNGSRHESAVFLLLIQSLGRILVREISLVQQMVVCLNLQPVHIQRKGIGVVFFSHLQLYCSKPSFSKCQLNL